MKLFFDIETLPASRAMEPTLRPLYDKYLASRPAGSTGSPRVGKIKSYDEFLRSTALDGAWGRVFCIGYAVDDQPAATLGGDKPEKKIISRFWELAGKAELIIGHNIVEFDLLFLFQRSVILEVKPSRDLPGKKYTSEPVFDTYQEWTKWSRHHRSGSLDRLARALNFPSSKGDIDGSRVYDYYLAGKRDEILEYCKRDVELTRKIYHRLTFS